MKKIDLFKSFLEKVKKILFKQEETQQTKEKVTMKKKELIMSALEKMGYSPEIDNDGDVMFRYQMKAIYVMTGDDEEPYISMLLPQFHEIEEGQETLVIAVCNKMTRELKLVKVYVDHTFKNVSATCEFFYANEEALEQCLRHSLHMLGIVRTVFRNDLAELSED